VPEANAASVPTLISRDFACVALVAARCAVARLAGDDLAAGAFFGIVFDERRVRTGRSVMACTSLYVG
jgi:hypothetical protein